MAFNPSVSFFVAFHELDPWKQRQCIFYTLKGKRCRWTCQEQDNDRARELHDQIKRMTSTEFPSLEILQNYATYNCCGPKPKGVRHQNRIEDIELLVPLAERWLDEILQQRLADPPIALSSSSATEYGQDNNLALTGPSVKLSSSPSIESSHSNIYTSTPDRISTVEADGVIVSQPAPVYSSEEAPKPTEYGSQLGADEVRYDLRPRGTIENVGRAPRALLSIFRPHSNEPSENVFSKILTPLIKDDFKTGSLYIFNRASSPGYVKIGWTSLVVQGRLDSWSRCGYEPNLLFSVTGIPHAQRAETLVQYELFKEWRAERRCKGCGKSHQEWFEVNQEKAAQIVADWAEFMRLALPYDATGLIKSNWQRTLEDMNKTNGPVTADKLLSYYRASLPTKDILQEPLGVDKAIDAEVFTREISHILGRGEDKADLLGATQPLLGAKFPFVSTAPTIKPHLSFAFQPQGRKIKFPLPTSPLRKAENPPDSRLEFRLEPSLIERKEQETTLRSSAKFEVERELDFSSLDDKTPPEKQSASDLDTKFDLSSKTLVTTKLDSGLNTKSIVSWKKLSAEKPVLETDADFSLLCKTPPAKQSILRTGGEVGSSFETPPGEKRCNLRTGKEFDSLGAAETPAQQLASEIHTKLNFSFTTPPSHSRQSLLSRDKEFNLPLLTPSESASRNRPFQPVTSSRPADSESLPRLPRQHECPSKPEKLSQGGELITGTRFMGSDAVDEHNKRVEGTMIKRISKNIHFPPSPPLEASPLPNIPT